jgi:hypothetical protein
MTTMPTFAWWIDDPLIKGRGNPTDEDLRELRAQGFTIAVSLLEENKQPPRYDKKSAEAAGWSIHSIPIEEGCAPLLEQRVWTARIMSSQANTCASQIQQQPEND